MYAAKLKKIVALIHQRLKKSERISLLNHQPSDVAVEMQLMGFIIQYSYFSAPLGSLR